MLRVQIPMKPVPENMVEEVSSLQSKLAVVSSVKSRETIQKDLEKAQAKISKFVEDVGIEEVPVPSNIVGDGDAAVQSFIDGQIERLAVEAEEAKKVKKDASSKKSEPSAAKEE